MDVWKAVYERKILWFVYSCRFSYVEEVVFYVVLDVLGDRRILSLDLKIVSFFHEMNVFVGKKVNICSTYPIRIRSVT